MNNTIDSMPCHAIDKVKIHDIKNSIKAWE